MTKLLVLLTGHRYLSWLEPLMNLVQSSDPQSMQQSLRCVVNITFDCMMDVWALLTH